MKVRINEFLAEFNKLFGQSGELDSCIANGYTEVGSRSSPCTLNVRFKVNVCGVDVRFNGTPNRGRSSSDGRGGTSDIGTEMLVVVGQEIVVIDTDCDLIDGIADGLRVWKNLTFDAFDVRNVLLEGFHVGLHRW